FVRIVLLTTTSSPFFLMRRPIAIEARTSPPAELINIGSFRVPAALRAFLNSAGVSGRIRPSAEIHSAQWTEQPVALLRTKMNCIGPNCTLGVEYCIGALGNGEVLCGNGGRFDTGSVFLSSAQDGKLTRSAGNNVRISKLRISRS